MYKKRAEFLKILGVLFFNKTWIFKFLYRTKEVLFCIRTKSNLSTAYRTAVPQTVDKPNSFHIYGKIEKIPFSLKRTVDTDIIEAQKQKESLTYITEQTDIF